MQDDNGGRLYYSRDSLQSLDDVDANILRELSTYDPRNISLLARKLKKPIETIRYRYNRLARILDLRLTSYVVYSRVGLKRLSLVCFLSPKQVKSVGKALENFDYWTYLSRFYGVADGFYAVYALPAEQSEFLMKYLATLNQHGLMRFYRAYPTGDPHVIAANFSRFDFGRHAWCFEWKEWLKELDSERPEGPGILGDPGDFSFNADRVCLRILDKIEDNAATSFVDISEAMDLTPQDIRYHYFRHLLGRGIISGFRPTILPYPRSQANMYTLFLQFHDSKSMHRFADWLPTTFIAMSYSKVIGENSLVVHSYIPNVEENNMHDFLYRMSEQGYLDDYFYVPLDMRNFKGWSTRPEKFNGHEWELNQEAYLQRLREIVEEAPPVSVQQAMPLGIQTG